MCRTSGVCRGKREGSPCLSDALLAYLSELDLLNTRCWVPLAHWL